MASNKCGYECEFVEKPPKAFQSECPVCLLVLREPYQVTCCGYAFCRVCIERIKQDNPPCPCCNSKDFDKFEDKRLKRSLYEFKVYCINKQQDCKWVGELGELDSHLNSNPSQESQLEGCQFVQVKCLHCSELVQRSSIQVHQRKQCPRRPFTCEYCRDFDSNYEDITTNHWPECGYYPVQCKNRCGKLIKRRRLKAHISNDCPLTVIDCDFSHVGCKVKLPRKDMAAHLTDNIVEHASLHARNYKKVVNQLDHLKQQNKKLKQQVAQMTEDLKLQQICTPICPVEFKMTNFEQHEIDDDEWISPPFYTHPKGYKMCLVVGANSYREYDGTHTSVGVYLMKGEFDDQLKWPFRGYITIRLLSQEGHRPLEKQFSYTGTEPNYDDIANRVMTKGDIAENGQEMFDFISHADLKPKYLRHDFLKFSVHQYKGL